MTSQPDPTIDLHPQHLALVRKILADRVPGCKVWVFGSRANNNAKPYSDLDLVINAQQALTLDIKAALADDFAESDLPIKVDIVDWHSVSDAFRDVIENNRVVLQG